MHQKHPRIKRPARGRFGKVEFAFVGSNCARMETDMQRISKDLSEDYRVATLVAEHQPPAQYPARQVAEKQLLSTTESWNEYDDLLLGARYDVTMVNGNHYPAARQIVYVDVKKAGTLERRSEQLTDVLAIVLCPGETEIPSWLQEKIAGQETPVFQHQEATSRLVKLIEEIAGAARPRVKALILAGGKSSRMGSDKASLIYRNGKTEAERLAEYTEGLGLETYFSLSENESEYYGRPVIGDRFLGLGPMGAIASAFLFDPEVAWLVLACDLPLLEKEHIAELLAKRDSRKVGTAVRKDADSFPEPLIAIYEPRAYARLLQFLTLGYACPRKLLINSDIATLEFKENSALTNANTPAEREMVLEKLKNNG